MVMMVFGLPQRKEYRPFWLGHQKSAINSIWAS